MNRLAFAVFLLVPTWVWACPVCFSATEENRGAFIWTTVFLTVLPLSVVGGAVWWFKRRLAAANEPGSPL